MKNIATSTLLVLFCSISLQAAPKIQPSSQKAFSSKQKTQVKTPEEIITNLELQLKACQNKKTNLLQQCDLYGCLKNIHTLQSQLDLIEQRESIAPLKSKMGTIICRMTTPNNKGDHKAMCSALKSMDTNMQQFRIKNHKQVAAIERRIAELTQKLLNNMPQETKTELKELLAEHGQLSAKIEHFKPVTPSYTRQPHTLELLFI